MLSKIVFDDNEADKNTLDWVWLDNDVCGYQHVMYVWMNGTGKGSYSWYIFQTVPFTKSHPINASIKGEWKNFWGSMYSIQRNWVEVEKFCQSTIRVCVSIRKFPIHKQTSLYDDWEYGMGNIKKQFCKFSYIVCCSAFAWFYK